MEQNQNQPTGTNTPKTGAQQAPPATTPDLTNLGTTVATTPSITLEKPKAEESATITHNLDVNPVTQAKDNTAITHKIQIRCNIRRKPFMGGLPGTDPVDRQYKIGASLNINSKKPLKGIEGELEAIIMPKIISIASHEPSFQRQVEDYWNNIGVIIPPDEDAGKEEHKGKIIDLTFTVRGTLLKESIDRETNIENKLAIISKGIIDKTIDIEKEDMYFDFVFLCYCIRNKEVANDVEKMYYSPKIKYYVFNKAITTAKKYNVIKLKDDARPLFEAIRNDDMKLNAMLMMFNLLPSAYTTTMDKVVALDEVYDKNAESLTMFITFAKDADLDLKYLIKLAVKKNKITILAGTDSHYYNQILLGRNINDTVLFLKDPQPENQNIRKALEREVKD